MCIVYVTRQRSSIGSHVCTRPTLGLLGPTLDPIRISSRVKKSKPDIAVRNRNYHTPTGNHMPYEITQCYLPPVRGDFPAFTPAEAGTRFSDPGGMQGWVDLSMVCVSVWADCPPTWTQYTNMHVPGGRPSAARLLNDCLKNCFGIYVCTGADWIPSKSECWLHGSWSKGQISALRGVEHFALSRSACAW